MLSQSKFGLENRHIREMSGYVFCSAWLCKGPEDTLSLCPLFNMNEHSSILKHKEMIPLPQTR